MICLIFITAQPVIQPVINPTTVVVPTQLGVIPPVAVAATHPGLGFGSTVASTVNQDFVKKVQELQEQV